MDQYNNFTYSKTLPSEFTSEETHFVQPAFSRLVEDGYSELRNGTYFLSFKGKLALQERFFGLYRERPYERAELRQRIQDVWNIVKIVAAVLNALALIYLGYRAVS